MASLTSVTCFYQRQPAIFFFISQNTLPILTLGMTFNPFKIPFKKYQHDAITC